MQNQQLTHHVFFWLNNPNSESDRAALIDGMKKLPAISLIRQYQIGLPVASERAVVDSSWSVSLLLVFENSADEAVYQGHPIHLEFIEKCKHLWQKVVVFDAIG